MVRQSERPTHLLAVLAASVLLACDPGDSTDAVDPGAGGKADTGYLSNIAVEIEGEYRGTVSLSYPDLGPAEVEAVANDFRTGVTPVEVLVTQLKFGKNQFNRFKLHMNLIDDDTRIDGVRVEGTTVHIDYAMIADAVVSYAELDAANLELEDLIGDRFEAMVPADPRDLEGRVGTRCATDDVKEEDLEDWNYFYYFDPDKEGCDIELAVISLELHKMNDNPEAVYPEYDRLVEDGKIEAVVFFGAAGHETEVASNDWGVREWTDFENKLTARGFASKKYGKGNRFQRTREGVDEIVDVYSPYTLQEHPDALFIAELKAKEILIYTGHSFYGSLRVLDDRENYTQGKYQVLFMSACWTYEYYTKQVFKNKSSDADPTGWRDADVVNDTEVGWFHNYENVSSIVLHGLLDGAMHGGKHGEVTYDWGSIIETMNELAVDAYEQRNTKTHEIFGVSGVRTNAFQPE